MRIFCLYALLTIAICWLLPSCQSTKKAFSNELKIAHLRGTNSLFTYSTLNNPAVINNTLPKVYESVGNVKVKLREDAVDGLFITASNSSDIDHVGSSPRNSGFKIKYKKEAPNPPFLNGRFSPVKAATNPPTFFFNPSDGKNHFGVPEGTIKYRQLRLYLQALTIAIKFRKKIGEDLDRKLPSAPAQIESGSGVATIALATGVKHSWSKYTGAKNALGFGTVSHSLAGGILVGLGSADLKASSTRGQITGPNFETKNLTIPIGIHVVYGYNNINVGFALGQDIITGPNRTEWNYFGKCWSGIIIGIDIIK